MKGTCGMVTEGYGLSIDDRLVERVMRLAEKCMERGDRFLQQISGDIIFRLLLIQHMAEELELYAGDDLLMDNDFHEPEDAETNNDKELFKEEYEAARIASTYEHVLKALRIIDPEEGMAYLIVLKLYDRAENPVVEILHQHFKRPIKLLMESLNNGLPVVCRCKSQEDANQICDEIKQWCLCTTYVHGR